MKTPSLQFIYDGMLLSFHGPIQPDLWEVISDLSVAKSRTWDQTDAFPIWSDLRQHVAASSGAWKVKPDDLMTTIHDLVSAYTPLPFVELEDDIAGDLIDCVNYELQGESEERLYSMILEAYATGGWPCGWSGEYPFGKLCVFWPAEPVIISEPTSIHDRRVALQKRKLRERIVSAAESCTEPE